MNITRERLTTNDAVQSSTLFYRLFAAYRFCQTKLRGKSVLDIGCSDGYGSFVLAKYAKKVVAIDIDKETIENAKKKYKLPTLAFIADDALRFSSKVKFDAVVSFQVIEHIQHVDLYLRKIRSVLKKNGFVIFSTPNRKLRLDRGQTPWNKYHVREYSSKSLQQALSKHFTSISILGLHATSQLYALEKKRLLIRRLIAKYDIFQVYNFIPRQITDRLVFLLRMFQSSNNKQKVKDISEKDYWVDEKDINSALDLIAVCKL